MKSFKPKPEMYDKRDLSQKMQEQEKNAQRREDLEAKAAKVQAKEEQEYVQPTHLRRRVDEAENETDFAFLVENRLTEITNMLMQLTSILVDRLPKVSKVDAVTANAPPPLKTVNGGHPILSTGKPAPFIEVPTYETVLKAAKPWKEKHGQSALMELLKSFKVESISKLNDEQKAEFLERITNDQQASVQE